MGRLRKVEHSSTARALLGTALGLWIAGVVGAAIVWVPPARGFADPESARLVILHVPLAIMAVVAYLVSTIYAISFLVRRRLGADLRSAVSASLGFWFTVAATLTGMVFASSQWGSAWNWDPRETSILMLLIVYAGYFALRGAIADGGARRRISAVYNIIACIVMPYLVFVVPRVMGGLHPTNAHLSFQYRITMLASAIGFAWVYIWLFRSRVRAREI